jgi:hydroxymethylglutaryl-CoA lyase
VPTVPRTGSATLEQSPERPPAGVAIREVGPRDGLQSEHPLPPRDRAGLVDQLAAAGCSWIEAVSFVSERAVPAMAGAAEVIALLGARASFRLTALVPNRRGAVAALEAGVDELTVTISASATYNERNVHRSIEASLLEVAAVCELAGAAGVPVDAVVSCAFGSPYEGDIDPDEVQGLCRRLEEAGCHALTLADTTGMATPRLMDQLLSLTGTDVGLHLHETRGTGLLNAYVALQAGVRRFDTAVGGLGGSPFAAGAGGNLATEDFVALLDDLGLPSGIDIDGVIAAADTLATLLGHPVPSKVSAAGPRTRLEATGAPDGP